MLKSSREIDVLVAITKLYPSYSVSRITHRSQFLAEYFRNLMTESILEDERVAEDLCEYFA
jgi:hypothetical protein